jgi:hypothetical protein
MDAPTQNLGGLQRKPDERDLLLGSVAAPVQIPATFLPDNTWLQRNYQGQTPCCGPHALSHLKAILDRNENPLSVPRYTPRYLWIRVKQIDGAPLESGTDMRSLFKILQQWGADDYEPLENPVTFPIAEYSELSALTPAMDANAATKTISSYAFDALDFASLQQLIYKFKAVLLLIHCDSGFWGTSTPTFTTAPYTHFVCADGYDENNIRIIDSADPNNAFGVKMIAKEYVIPKFILESGTAIDPATAQAIKSTIVSDSATVVQDVAEDTQISAPQKESILEEVEEIIESIV